MIGRHRTRIRWNGAAVKAKVREAVLVGVDRTLTMCVARARDDHGYMSRTGYMEMSVTVWDWAKPELGHVRGKWGAHANYGLFLEIGTSRWWSGAPRAAARAAAAMGNMWAISLPQPDGPHTDTRWIGGQKLPGEGPLMDPHMSLRPAADREYPLLKARIAAAYRGDPLP